MTVDLQDTDPSPVKDWQTSPFVKMRSVYHVPVNQCQALKQSPHSIKSELSLPMISKPAETTHEQ
jgi:hypothetical protein